MIRITCPKCKSRLNAKKELAGQTRKCPKCGGPVVIPQPSETEDSSTNEAIALEEADPEQHIQISVEEKLPDIATPERLVRTNRYLICDKTKIIATWQNNGEGWMLKTSHGNINATRNCEQLPAQGIFTLVELDMLMMDQRMRLRAIHCYKLADRWALTALDQGDNSILARLTGPGYLNKEQKGAVRKFLIEEFMRDVWHDAREVMDYLSNTDYHSPGTAYRPIG